MSEPNTSWVPDDLSDDNDSLSEFTRDLMERHADLERERNYLDDGAGASAESEPMSLSYIPNEPANDSYLLGAAMSPVEPTTQHEDDYKPQTSTSSGGDSGSSKSGKNKANPGPNTRGARTRLRNNNKNNFNVGRGQGRGEVPVGQEIGRGSRSYNYGEGPSQARGEYFSERGESSQSFGRSHSLGFDIEPPSFGPLNPSAEEHINSIMNNLNLVYIATPVPRRGDDSHQL